MSLSELNDSSMIIQSILLRLVTVATMENLWRTPPTAIRLFKISPNFEALIRP